MDVFLLDSLAMTYAWLLSYSFHNMIIQPLKRATPKQQRSVDRVKLILEATEQCIVKSGVSGTNMSNIAKQAQFTKASLYRYFPNFQAILGALADQHIISLKQELMGLLQGLDLEQPMHTVFFNAADGLIDLHMNYYLSQPGYLEISAAVATSPILAELDRQAFKESVESMIDISARLMPHINRDLLTTSLLVVVKSSLATMYLALEHEADQRAQLISELKLMTRLYLQQRFHLNAD